MGEKGKQNSTINLWLRWVLANLLAGTVGLGATFGLGVTHFPYLSAPDALIVLETVAVAVLAGTLIEGTVVGTRGDGGRHSPVARAPPSLAGHEVASVGFGNRRRSVCGLDVRHVTEHPLECGVWPTGLCTSRA
jgi:hypothetical protein